MAILAVDSHAHFHRAHVAEVALVAALAHLARLPGAGTPATPRAGDGARIERALVMVDPPGADDHARLVDGAAHAGFGVAWSADRACATLWRGEDRLHLLAGAQLVSAEGVEVLALGRPLALAAPLPLADCLAAAREAGALAVLPWSPGKWLGRRGRVVRSLLAAAAPGEVLVGDVPARPRLLRSPLLALAARRGLSRVAGSDPLPAAGEERALGRLGTVCVAAWDEDRPAVALLAALAGGGHVAGARDGFLAAVVRLLRHRRRHPRSKQEAPTREPWGAALDRNVRPPRADGQATPPPGPAARRAGTCGRRPRG